MSSSVLSVTTPAGDLALLTIEELRAAVGVTIGDSSQDATLATLGTRVADRITQACNVATDGAKPPTLREETLSETWRLRQLGRGSAHHHGHGSELLLARRPIVSVTSIEEDGIALDPADYEILAASGMLRRLSGDAPRSWSLAGKIVVVYVAGWATVPESLKFAAEQLARVYWFQQTRDPALKQISIPGVIERQFWVDTSNDHDIPQDVMDILEPYRNRSVG